MSIHFPPAAFRVPAGVIAGAILSHERSCVPQPITLAQRPVMIFGPSEDLELSHCRDITPTHGRDTSDAVN